MFSNLKKKINKSTSEAKWSILQGQNNGKIMVVRRNNSVNQFSANPEFIYRIGFAIPLVAPNNEGLPSTEEMNTLNQIEDELSKQLEKDGVSIQVLSITTGGMREYVYYTKDSKIVEKVIGDVRGEFSSYEIQYYVEEDKAWSLYKQYI